jgi:dolichol kinase
MFVASVVVVAVFCLLFGEGSVVAGPNAAGWIVVAALATGLVATAIEVFTPLGIDNLTVPILTSLFFYAVFV